MRGTKWAESRVKRGQVVKADRRNREGRRQSASWHIHLFAYYFAAVVVCLLIKDNPIKTLKSSLRRNAHTHTHTLKNTAQSGPSLGERTGCAGVCKACSFHPFLLQDSVPGAWGAETITCLHGGSILALELVSRLPACVPPQRYPVVCWLTGPPVHICPLTLCSSLISCSCLHRRSGFVKTLLCLSWHVLVL